MKYVVLDGTKFPIKENQTIVEAAAKAGVYIDYQCLDGICGICKCKLISGTIGYREEPLAPIQPDEILTCIAVVTSDCLTIKKS